ncbi:hypothetical protein TrispH2_000269 [Trichoplax sp. H2]|nr:hypothetical protein TrispH2_000269 [Trichoplax sp. H2]|eukprot:RDD47402.1 hypothetical protein TrispH2_000269 [Trichoplax sp. H2]
MAMSSTAVAGASLMIFGLGDVAISILATVDINSTIRYYGSISFLLMISSVLGTSMILGGLMCIIQHRFHKGMAVISIFTMMLLSLVCVMISAVSFTYYYARLPIYTLMTSRSVALFALSVFFHMSSFIILAYSIKKQSLQLSDFGEQRREQDEPLDAGDRVETAESMNPITFRHPDHQSNLLVILLCVIGGLMLFTGLADVFILQGLYATQTCLTGIFLLLAAGCGYLHEIRHINGAAAWSCVFFYISRLISIAAIGINITIFTNVRATYLNYHFSALAVFILSTIFMAIGFLLSVYAASVFKLRINKQTVHICPICLNASNSSLQLVFVWTGHFQFLSGLALWTVGLAAMIFNIFEHSSLHTFYLASLLLTTSRFASATNKNQSENAVYITMLFFCILASLMEIAYIVTGYGGWNSINSVQWQSSSIPVIFSLALSAIAFIGCLVSTFKVYQYQGFAYFSRNAQDVEELVESNMPDCTTSDDKDMGNDN